jgi:cytochrome c oxidase cbb3-type subunit 3
MHRYYKTAAILAIATIPLDIYAADAMPHTSASPSFNVLLTGLISLAIALLFAIGVLGAVLKSLVSVHRERMKNDENTPTITRNLLTLALLALPLFANAQDEVVAKAPEIIAGIAAADFYLLIGVIALELLVLIAMLAIMAMLVRMLSAKPETAKQAKALVSKPFWDRFNKAVEIEKEADIMLDHDYDGIRELDNSLPPWWKYGFYLTIVVAVVYMYYYHIGGNGPGSLQEYAMEVEKGEEQKALYLAQSANNVDENTVVMLDEAGIAAGEAVFQNMCAACHAKDGGGGVGPNLTDEYWLHGGSISDIFKSIKYGWPDKGMKSWKDDFSPKQIAELSSYIRALKGTQPAAPKEKQGELYQEQASTDSTAVAAK